MLNIQHIDTLWERLHVHVYFYEGEVVVAKGSLLQAPRETEHVILFPNTRYIVTRVTWLVTHNGTEEPKNFKLDRTCRIDVKRYVDEKTGSSIS